MKLMKLMPAALLLSLSLGVYAQDEDLSEDAVAEDEAAEVFVPSTPTEGRFFHRVQLGYIGTNAKYTNNSETWAIPMYEKYFLSGVTLGWMGDLRLNQKKPFYVELGAMFTYRTGTYDGNDYSKPSVNYDWHSRVQAFSIAIPVNVNYQFRNAFGVEDFTIAPFAGLYFRFNVVANRREERTTENYNIDVDGNVVTTGVDFKSENKSLMKYVEDGGWMKGRTHTGKLLQPGVQIGANAFYKRYSFGLSYMYDLVPFAKHSSPEGLTYKDKSVGGITPSSGTGCDMEISTRHNFAVTVGYVF